MGFLFLYIYIMEQQKKICSNPWCKGTFFFTEQDFVEVDGELLPPTQCKKCLSFSNELSGGVEWVDKKYEGSRDDGTSHSFRYKVTNFRL